MKKTPEQQLKLSIIAVLIALLVVVTGMAFVYKKNQQGMLQKDLKISMLINEIGEIKNQNEKLYEYVGSEKENLGNTLTQIKNVQQTIGQMGMDVSKQKQLQTELTSANNNLLNLVQVKQNTIKSLKQNLASDSTSKIQGQTNILILGENMQLTDTIMLASINETTKKVTLLSIPRDLFYNGRKINEYYEKYGVSELESVIGAVTGIAPDKYVVIDMKSFVNIIDLVGGIDIDVKKGIIDDQYPGPNSTYIKVSFKKGYQHMDGQRALRYARSRKSTTDFDRSERQQEIILALKQKAEELDLKNNIGKLTEIYNAVKDKVKTDVSLLDELNYYNNYRSFEIKTGNTINTQNFLYSTYNTAGQYILLPFKSSFIALQNYVKKITEE